MTHTIIFLTKFSPKWPQLPFQRNLIRYLHTILLTEPRKGTRLRELDQMGERADQSGLKCFLAFFNAVVLNYKSQYIFLTKDGPLDTSERLIDVFIFVLQCVVQLSLESYCINKTTQQSASSQKLFIEQLQFQKLCQVLRKDN